MRVKHIKFSAVNPLSGSTRQVQWSLGMGPCGRWVESLEVDITLAVVTIKQTSYAADQTALMDSAIKQLMERKVNLGAFDTVYTDSLGANTKTKEIKTFIYKLEDVRGRIEAIEVGKI